MGDDLEVRIVELEPMRVASVRVVAASPEQEAWEKLRAWAEPRGLWRDAEKHPVFGFNNPNPSAERKEYGYELWIRVGPDASSDADVEVKDVPGGLYAVTACKLLGDPRGSMPDVWRKLWDWCQASEYRWRHTHELEKPQDPRAAVEEMVLDLYLPIEA
ncbi:MAG: AraC family transcriptional regulator [Planctomycetota bacterium]|jgi:DNA gyrase inhibitor GyrI